ncbi:hypothetical protein AB0D99_22160 [Streptomyces sp. NPDC047971]
MPLPAQTAPDDPFYGLVPGKVGPPSTAATESEAALLPPHQSADGIARR